MNVKSNHVLSANYWVARIYCKTDAYAVLHEL